MRSLLFQAVFNYERMQNVGFAYCLSPALERLYAGRDEALALALKRHLLIFNSHPYLSARVIGAALNLEEEIAAGRQPPESVHAMKQAAMTGIAAVGDSFFWSSLRPFLAISVVGLMLMKIIWAPLLFLALYNVVHLSLRLSGFIAGYRYGIEAVIDMTKTSMPLYSKALQYLSAIAIAYFSVIFNHKAHLSDRDLEFPTDFFLYFTLAGITFMAIRRRTSIIIVYAVAFISPFVLIYILNRMFPLI
ncbi:PTS system mannose/fructose/sorbose family transporter subunit IID [Myxococcota bacterium]|nr:PTS system mannose/fructose/sorbose family transporter subunit IID [Myxococcota bacterium]MBU1432958.1 PTS system mannose/fructose/sorbose family transporter subunit IID [Myxococcota bacterium]MBU1896312.1 PTS system mannose/fructose/sorbose family transporter subunit IID [Myxococcota bacterium]